MASKTDVLCVQWVFIYLSLLFIFFLFYWGWSGGAMVLDKLSVPWRPTIWMIVGQGLLGLQ